MRNFVRNALGLSALVAFAIPSAAIAQEHHQPLDCADGVRTKLAFSTTPNGNTTYQWPTGSLAWTANNVGGAGTNVAFQIIDPSGFLSDGSPFTDTFISSTMGAAMTVEEGIPGGDVFIDMVFTPPILGAAFDVADVNSSAGDVQGDLLLISGQTPGGQTVVPQFDGSGSPTWSVVNVGTEVGVSSTGNSADEADEQVGVTFQQELTRIRIRWRDCLTCGADFHGIQLLPIDLCVNGDMIVPPPETTNTVWTAVEEPVAGQVTGGTGLVSVKPSDLPVPGVEGTLVMSPNGTFTFTPAPGFVGVIEVPYAQGSGSGVLTLVVNDPPEVTDVSNSVTPGSVTTVPLTDLVSGTDVVAGDLPTDVESPDDALSAQTVAISSTAGAANNAGHPSFGSTTAPNTSAILPAGGSCTVDATGAVTVTAPTAAGTYTCHVRVCEENPVGSVAICSIADVSVTVTGTVAAPVANNDQAQGTPDQTISGNLSPNDTVDPSGTPTYTIAPADLPDPATEGTLTLQPNGSYAFDPVPGFAGVLTIPYTLTDGLGGSDTATLTITTNDPPVAADPDVTVPPGGTTTVPLDDLVDSPGTVAGDAPNDVESPDDPYNAGETAVSSAPTANDNPDDPSFGPLGSPNTAATLPGGGQCVIGAGGAVTVTAPTAPGTYHCYVRVCEEIPAGNTGVCTVSDVEIVVPPPAGVLTAVADNYSTPEGTAITINTTAAGIAGNDSVPAGVTATVSVAPADQPDPATEGTLVVQPDGTFVFVPAAGFSGTLTIPYTLSDGQGGTSMSVITIIVDGLPDAMDDMASTGPDTPVSVDVLDNDSDPEGTPLDVTMVTDPPNGTAVIEPDGTITYTPDPGFTGPDTFQYTVCDAAGNCEMATVTVDVKLPAGAPVAADDEVTTPEDTPVLINATENDEDPDGDPVTVSAVTEPPTSGTAVVNPDGTITYTPDPGFTGTDTFTYEACDDTGLCDTAIVIVEVTVPEDVAPVATDDETSTQADTPVTVDVAANDESPSDEPFEVTEVTEPTSGDVVIEPDGTVTYTPDPGFAGTDTFDYTITDGNGLTDTATVTVTVGPNANPEATDDTAMTPEETPIAVDVLSNDNDPEAAPLTVTEVTEPSNGTAEIQPDGTILYTPFADFTGPDTFTYTVCDGAGGCDTAEVEVIVTPAQDAPVAIDDEVSTAPATPVSIDALANDDDPDGDPLTITETSDPANGTAVVAADGTITYTPDAGFTGDDTFTYTIDDGNGGTAEATVLVHVGPDNTDPVAIDDEYMVPQDTATTLDVLDNDSDPEGDTLVIADIVQPEHGTVTLDAAGNPVYTPDAGYAGPDEFTYTISDGNGGEDTATVVLNVGDSDGDGLGDLFEENVLGTDPLDPDTDGDGIPDGDEVNGTGPLAPYGPTDPLDLDSDDDGIEDGEEALATGPLTGDEPTDPTDPDSDDDGLPDGLEAGVTDPVDSDTSDGPGAIPVAGTDPAAPTFIPDTDPTTTTDPNDPDSDDDGLEDGVEDANTDGQVTDPVIGDTGTPGSGETDPTNPDSDEDGLQDGPEVNDIGSDPMDTDTDDGSVPDGVEVLNGLDPLDPDDDTGLQDSDNDGLGDPLEEELGTDPNDPDTDGDGINDGDEVGGSGPLTPFGPTDPLDLDSDDDGITDGDEANGTGPLAGDDPTDPTTPDTDEDGLPDGLEAGVTEPVPDGVSDGPEMVPVSGTDTAQPSWTPDADPSTTTDPNDPDSDDDGLKDGEEDANGDGQVTDPVIGDTGTSGGGETNPEDPDSDDDGLTDGQEVNETGSDPMDTDTDDGGVDDGAEVTNELDPLDPADDAGFIDSDGDGLPDALEEALGTDPNDPDTDGDGIEDGDEVNGTGPLEPFGETDPLDLDSDDDGIEDGDEALATGPLSGLSDGPTDPTDGDTDNDGLSDGLEAGVTEPVPDGTSDGPGAVEISGTDVDAPTWVPDADPSTTTDPTNEDSDDDGLEDGEEDTNSDGEVTDPVIGDTGSDGSGETDPNNPDSDSDGVEDGPEVEDYGSDPMDTDTDDGSLGDGIEVANGLDPLDPNDDTTLVDTDEDGLGDPLEETLGTDPNDPDSDNDGLTDFEELQSGVPGLLDLGEDTDPLDSDSDDDGINDGDETNGAGPLSELGPTDPLDPDTDDDGLVDGLEAGVTEPVPGGISDGNDVPFGGTDEDEGNFVPDADPNTTTDPSDDDTDDDGLIDGNEDDNQDGAVDNVIGDTGTDGSGETDPNNVDTDEDGIQDGTESGLEAPEGDDTDLSIFMPDAHPSSTTNPLDVDTDDGGIFDGTEDINANGAVDADEGDPLDPSDDTVGSGGLLVRGGACNSGGSPLTLPLALAFMGIIALARRREVAGR